VGDGVAQLGGFGVQRGEREVAERGGEAGGGDGGCGCGHERLRRECWSNFLVSDWKVLVIYKLFGGLELGWSWRWVAEMQGGSEYTERGCFLGRGSLK